LLEVILEKLQGLPSIEVQQKKDGNSQGMHLFKSSSWLAENIAQQASQPANRYVIALSTVLYSFKTFSA
jgi:hypothetical protein